MSPRPGLAPEPTSPQQVLPSRGGFLLELGSVCSLVRKCFCCQDEKWGAVSGTPAPHPVLPAPSLHFRLEARGLWRTSACRLVL